MNLSEMLQREEGDIRVWIEKAIQLEDAVMKAVELEPQLLHHPLIKREVEIIMKHDHEEVKP